MKAYEVTAANKWFYQRLLVLAETEDEASQKFTAYLSTPAAMAHEDYELSQVSCLGDEADPQTLIRSNYAYKFAPHSVEEFDGRQKPSHEVQMIDSGGNG